MHPWSKIDPGAIWQASEAVLEGWEAGHLDRLGVLGTGAPGHLGRQGASSSLGRSAPGQVGLGGQAGQDRKVQRGAF
jgi:hypothetical protein